MQTQIKYTYKEQTELQYNWTDVVRIAGSIAADRKLGPICLDSVPRGYEMWDQKQFTTENLNERVQRIIDDTFYYRTPRSRPAFRSGAQA